MPKTLCFFFLFLSGCSFSQEDTLKPVLPSIPSNDSIVFIVSDSTSHTTLKEVSRVFLYRTTTFYYSNDTKRYKTVWRRRFMRNVFIRNEFERRTNFKSKSWNKDGKLICKNSIKPYGSDGKRRKVKKTFSDNGKLKSKEIIRGKGSCFGATFKTRTKYYGKK